MRQVRKYLIIFLGGALVLGGLFILLGKPMQFETIKIIGAHPGTIRELEQLFIKEAQNLPWAALLGYRNILLWPSGELQSQDPRLSGSRVKRDILNKRLEIILPERERILVWCGEICYWLDGGGRSMEEAPKTDGTLVPTINATGAENYSLGYPVIPPELFGNLRRVLSIFQSIGMPEMRLNVDVSGKELIAQTDGLATIYLNLKNDPEIIAEPLRRLIKFPGLNKLSYVDFRIENRVYYR